MGELWVVRHGETEWSRSGRHTGRTDVPLTDHGEDQARELSLRLDRPWRLVLCSPLQRAVRTAELAGLRATPDRDLAEWAYGPAEGLTTAELSAEAEWSVWDDVALGETVDEVGRRAARVISRAEPQLARGDVCLVAHGHLLRVLAAVWLGLEPRAGRLWVLDPARTGVLGHEHARKVISTWNV
ncbi:MAG: histidine phosphatase family protein [Actinomycetota bacterium]|nr:histidine phosphatase family protein [Actinomycetota bacterium]